VVDEEAGLDQQPTVGEDVADQEPMLGAEGDEQEGAGPEVAGQAVAQAVAQAGNGPVGDGQVRSRELLGEELAYR
jgi:hypothetical protein